MAYEAILVGSGEIFVAPVGETFPAVNAVPAGTWLSLGEIDGGVTVNHEQKLDEHYVDSETAPVKVTRSQEGVTLTCNLADATLENLARLLNNQTVIPAVGPPATRKIGMYRGFQVQEFSVLFRANSPYGPYPAQFELPRGYVGGNFGRSFVKDTKTLTPVEFHVMVDDNAITDAEKFGRLVAQSSA